LATDTLSRSLILLFDSSWVSYVCESCPVFRDVPISPQALMRLTLHSD